MDRICFVVLAGEPDLNLWPKARLRKPGFMMQMPGGSTILRRIWETAEELQQPAHLLVITPEAYLEPASIELGGLASPESRISWEVLPEPANRGAHNSLGLAMAHLSGKAVKGRKSFDAPIIAVPSNLYITETHPFADALKRALETCDARTAFVTITSKGAYPEPDYVYIKTSQGKTGTHAVGISAKPGRAGAVKLMNDPEYAWGTGVLIFKSHAWWKFMLKRREDEQKSFQAIKLSCGTGFYKRVLQKEYAGLRSSDLWEGVIKECAVAGSRNLCVVDAPCESWVLLNGWRNMSRLEGRSPGSNLTGGPVLSLECSECLLESTRSLLVAIGLQNVAVVASDDVVLVCNKDRQDELRSALDLLRANGMHRYL